MNSSYYFVLKAPRVPPGTAPVRERQRACVERVRRAQWRPRAHVDLPERATLFVFTHASRRANSIFFRPGSGTFRDSHF